MGWTKIIAINVLVLMTLLLGVEILARIGSSALSCIRLECNFSPLLRASTTKRQSAVEPRLVIFRPDSHLGYVPIAGVDGIRNDKGWNNKRVTITKAGFRANDDAHFDLEHEILAVGDSFTFGDQVANDETWPACLERKLKKGVANAGVSGYGAAQALERAKVELKKHRYKTIILSVLVGSDFDRDRRAVISTPNGLAWLPATPGDDTSGDDTSRKSESLTGKDILQSALVWLNANSFFANFFLANWFQEFLYREKYFGPEVTSKEDIIPWTLNSFATVEAEKKILLLQYGSYKSTYDLSERNVILEVASKRGLTVVDTLDIFSGYQLRKIWIGHHTPLGNAIVCDYLVEKAFN